MLEPQSTGLFVLLVVIFGGLIWLTIFARHTLIRVLAALLAFMPAMLFGVLAVNKYYGYYQTWGAVVADMTNQGVSAASGVPDITLASRSGSGTLDGSQAHLRLAQQQGYALRLMVTGPRSGITRAVYVYLPPQYFEPGYQAYRFPVIELIHGQPGQPEDWITVVGVTNTFDHLLAEHLARPAVLVMPDANGSTRISLQCLNQAGGPQDLTYLAVDLPTRIAHILRVQRPGSAWGVAGYSEGGFCAANMVLRYPHRYGFAGVLSGYFKPLDNQLAGPRRLVSPFGGDRRQQAENTPLEEIQQLPAGPALPRFWLGAGAADRQDVANAKAFWQELRPRQAGVPLTITPGCGHSMTTWRAQVPSMLTWMTPGLARAAHKQAGRPAAAGVA
jgi:enterochelin esterase-like enzyme